MATVPTEAKQGTIVRTSGSVVAWGSVCVTLSRLSPPARPAQCWCVRASLPLLLSVAACSLRVCVGFACVRFEWRGGVLAAWRFDCFLGAMRSSRATVPSSPESEHDDDTTRRTRHVAGPLRPDRSQCGDRARRSSRSQDPPPRWPDFRWNQLRRSAPRSTARWTHRDNDECVPQSAHRSEATLLDFHPPSSTRANRSTKLRTHLSASHCTHCCCCRFCG